MDNKRLSIVGMILLYGFTSLFAVSTSRADVPIDRPGSVSQKADSVVTVRAELKAGESERTGKLVVTAEIAKGYHIYAMTQPKPFIATRIAVAESARFSLSGPFQVSPRPTVHR